MNNFEEIYLKKKNEIEDFDKKSLEVYIDDKDLVVTFKYSKEPKDLKTRLWVSGDIDRINMDGETKQTIRIDNIFKKCQKL